MAGLRFSSVWLILFLLLGIIFENITERKEKPIVLFLQDNSESILVNKDSLYYKNNYKKEIDALIESINETFETATFSFSDKLTPDLTFSFDGKFSDISKSIEDLFEQYSSRNIGAIILATDGIYNTGANPIYAVSQKSFVPFYTIGLGDTNLQRDVKIDLVKHNEIAFLGNDFPVEINFSGIKSISEKIQITIKKDGNKISEQQFVFNDEFEQARLVFMLKANQTGFQKYTAEITHLENEFTYKNNSQIFYVEVIDGRQKILIAQNGPHPDVSALRFVIDNNQNYQTEVSDIKDVSDITPYDLIIIHNYNKGSATIDNAIVAGKTPMLFINGSNTDLNNLQNFKIGFSSSSKETEEVNFSINPNFKDILLSPQIIQMLQAAPPLQAPFGRIQFSGALDILAYQKLGNIQLDFPLIYFTNKESSRYGVIMGEGIWRWRLFDQMRYNTTEHFEEFIAKLITYLAVKENRDPFRINLKNEYFENEEIIVGAELYNKSFELINEPDVYFIFTNEAGNEFKPTFYKTEKAYQLNLGKLQPGVYSWQANTKFQNKNYIKKGTFLVKEIKLEWQNTTADHRLLKNIAQNTNGKFYNTQQINQIGDDLKSNQNLTTVVYQDKSFDDVINFKWLFWLIVFLLASEWIYRKYSGAY